MTALPAPIFQIGHLERLPLGTPYPAIVAHVGQILAKLPGHPELLIDFTGVGRPVFDMFVYSGIYPIGVIITGGTARDEQWLDPLGAKADAGQPVASAAP